jgi:hypothetical protein
VPAGQVTTQARADLFFTRQLTQPLPAVAGADDLVLAAACEAAGAAAGAAAAAVAADGTVVGAAGCPEIHVTGPLAVRMGASMVVMVVVVVIV